MSYLTDFFKLASDETRLRILFLLAQDELAVCEICGILDLPQPKVSKHLGKLRDTQFVTDKRKEKFVFYSLNLQDPTILTFFDDILAHLSHYPQLQEDSLRLASRQIYLESCKVCEEEQKAGQRNT